MPCPTTIVGNVATLGPFALVGGVAGEAGAILATVHRVLDAGGVVDTGLPVGVAELAGGGDYVATFTPVQAGRHVVVLEHAGTGTRLEYEVEAVAVAPAAAAAFTVVPLGREVVGPGQAVAFQVRFVLPDGAPFEPAGLRLVEIAHGATGAVLFSIGAAGIEPLGGGTYRVVTPVAVGEELTLTDRWFFRAFDGAETSRVFSRVVAQVADFGAPGEAAALIGGVKRLMDKEVLGVIQTLDDGSNFPAETYDRAITEAADEIGAELDLVLRPTLFEDEQHDYDIDRWRRFGHFDLDRGPVIEITRVVAVYPSTMYPLEIPLSWVVLPIPETRVFSLVPDAGTFSSFLMAQGGPSAMQPLPILRPSGISWWPGLWKISYRAGFPEGGLPPRIQKAIALKASIDILNIAGDLIVGAGIATKSVSIGGLSQSVGTTASATSHGYAAKILQYEKLLKPLLKQIRLQFHGVGLGVV
ncbi:MAG: hypothetical protein KC613_06650 [Myxococcales bacterium]|nr:hypothetical protein [Myxococcales bacterium]